MTQDEMLEVAEKLAAANFQKHHDALPPDQMFDITEPFGLLGDLHDDASVVTLYQVLRIAVSIAAHQANTLGELAEMIGRDLWERRGIEVETECTICGRDRDPPTIQ